MNDQRIPYTQPGGQPPPYQCTTCGTMLMPGQEVCPVCGCRVPLQAPPNIQTTDTKKAKRTRVRAIVLGIIAAVLVHSVVIMCTLAPFLIATPDKLMEKGDYIKAYEIAPDSYKNTVLAENVVAVLSDRSSQSLYLPSSFVLLEGYYRAYFNSDTGLEQQVALRISNANAFGGTITHYCLFVFNNETQEWIYVGHVFNTANSNYDDSSNLKIKAALRLIMTEGESIVLEEEQVQRINDQFQAETLDMVELIPIDKIDTSLFPTK